MFDGLLLGFETVLTAQNLLILLLSIFVGTAVGVMPGIGPLAGVALILPLTFTFGSTGAAIMITGIYCGAMYGGSTTAILLNIPGETASIPTTYDGYPMAKKGRGGVALATAALGSFVAGTLAVLLVSIFSPPLAKVGLAFGPAEFFGVAAGGLLIFARVSAGERRLSRSLVPLMLGILLSTVGQEDLTGKLRFTFGHVELGRGLSIVALALGIFAICEAIYMALGGDDAIRVRRKFGLRELIPGRKDLRRSVGPWGRGALIGFGAGLLPGPSGTLGSFASYGIERGISKRKEEFGHGAIEGVAGPEAANNAAATSSLVPVLALGLPFSATLAMMLSALTVQGVAPGPMFISQYPEIFWGLIVAMYLANVGLLIVNLPFVGLWVYLLRSPSFLIVPIILVFATYGAYSERSAMLDVYCLVIFGVMGYVLRKLDFDLTPLILGFLLGPVVESYFRKSLFMARGDLTVFVSGSICMVVWTLVVATLLGPSMLRLWRLSRARGPAGKLDIAGSKRAGQAVRK
ncbi:MAG: tripartite tricarboxylate transporter permease [Burkholderiaceae bacterium]